jgi:hypothetical protein
MGNQLYKQHLLLWTAAQNKDNASWIPRIIISWHEKGKYQFRRIAGAPQLSRDTALALGKKLAQSWVDRRL